MNDRRIYYKKFDLRERIKAAARNLSEDPARYEELKGPLEGLRLELAEKEFNDIVNTTNYIGGKASAPNKLRIGGIYSINPGGSVWSSGDGKGWREDAVFMCWWFC